MKLVKCAWHSCIFCSARLTILHESDTTLFSKTLAIHCDFSGNDQANATRRKNTKTFYMANLLDGDGVCKVCVVKKPTQFSKIALAVTKTIKYQHHRYSNISLGRAQCSRYWTERAGVRCEITYGNQMWDIDIISIFVGTARLRFYKDIISCLLVLNLNDGGLNPAFISPSYVCIIIRVRTRSSRAILKTTLITNYDTTLPTKLPP